MDAIALGKTISNETFVVDLAKMPHLLMVLPDKENLWV
jgi:DNA segregation ATPase FtsK/SpoIIIE-like protein